MPSIKISDDLKGVMSDKGFKPLSRETFYTPDEIATMLKLNYRTVLKAINKGELNAVRFGHNFRVTESDLKKYINYKG